MAEPKPPRKAAAPSTDELLRRWEADKKSRLFLQLAEEYRKQDFVDSALSVLREGLKVHPTFLPAHVALARCLMVKRQYAEAQDTLERVCKKAPDNILAGRLLAEVLETKGQRARALQVLESLVPFAPTDEEMAAKVLALREALAPPRVTSVAAPGEEHEESEFMTGEFETGSGGDEAAEAPVASAAPRAERVAAPGPPAGSLHVDDLVGPPRSQAAAPGDEDDFTSLTLAELYESQGAHAEAAAIYERLAHRNPGDADIARALARCRIRIAGEDVGAAAPPPPSSPPPRPTWQPVRPRETEAPARARSAVDSGPRERETVTSTMVAAAPTGVGTEEELRATARELRRWLDAVRAVRESGVGASSSRHSEE